MFVPDLVLGSGGWGVVAPGIEVILLLPGTWSASVVGLPQDLFTLDLPPSCGVTWAEPECSCLERDLWVLLPRCWSLGSCDATHYLVSVPTKSTAARYTPGPTPDVCIHDVDLPHH